MSKDTEKDAPPKGVTAKLVDIMKELKYLQKEGRVQSGRTSYKYVGEAQLKAALQPLLAKHRLLVVPNCIGSESFQTPTRNGGQMNNFLGTYVVRIIDADSGEVLELQQVGHGQDTGDKAPLKAQTVAVRHAFMTMLMIPTGDDPERDDRGEEQPQQAAQPPAPVADLTQGTRSKLSQELIRIGKCANPKAASKFIADHNVVTEAAARKWLQQAADLPDGGAVEQEAEA